MKNILFVLCIAVCMTTGCTWRQRVATTVGMVAGAAVAVATGADVSDASTSIEEVVAAGLGETMASEALGDTDESIHVYVPPAKDDEEAVN